MADDKFSTGSMYDWADEYDPTNPDGPEPKNMERENGTNILRDAMVGKYTPPPYDPLRTNLGPVGFVPGAPQVDPLPYDVPPNMHPDMEIRQDEGPFFTRSNRRGGVNDASRDINDYLQKMMPPEASKQGSPYRSMDIADSIMTNETPAVRLSTDKMMGHDYWPLTPLGVAAGGNDLDKYNRTFIMPNFARDERLGIDNSNYDDALTLRGMPDYMKKDAAEQLAKDAMDSKTESETVWEGTTAPTQGDIDKVNANPTDGMYQMFEDQFGPEATAKAFPIDEEKDPVPLPQPRPKSAPKRK